MNLLALTEEDFRRAVTSVSIGGSDVAVLTGDNPYDTRAGLWDKLMGAAPPRKENAAMARGTRLEPHAIEAVRQQMGWTVTGAATRVTHPRFPWLHASVDGLIEVPSAGLMPWHRDDPYGVLEVKCPMYRNVEKWRKDGPPPMYVAQLQQYLGLYERSWGAFAVFIEKDWSVQVYHVDFDPAKFAAIVDVSTAFWHDHVLTRLRPEEG